MMSHLKKCHFGCCLLLLLCTIHASPQINLLGKVITDSGDIPISNASVYFNNTTFGTRTNLDGEFKISIPNFLNTELVISCNGYEVLVYKPTMAQTAGKKFVFKLPRKDTTTAGRLELTDDVKQKWLGIFYETILGFSEEASKCTILNRSGIYFINGDTPSSFRIVSDSSMVFINTMLGYKISVDLGDFTYDVATGQNYFLGYTRYEETGDSKKYTKNRKHCFYGSSMHFYRSLIANQLAQQGFGTFLRLPLSDSLKEQSKRAGALLLPEEQSKIIPVTAQEILYIDSTNNYSIRLNGELLVQYNIDPYSKNYMERFSWTQGLLDKGTESYLNFKETPIGLNNFGVLSDPANVVYTGYWMYEHIANSLPYDYQPE